MGLFLFQQAGRKQLIFFLTAAFYPGTQVTSLFCWSGTLEAYCRFLLFWAQMKQKIHMLLFVDALIFYSTGAELSLALLSRGKFRCYKTSLLPHTVVYIVASVC